MSNTIYPRSPREEMDGWMHLPRFIDKVRLHLAGKLHEDYRPNLGKGFDGRWLDVAGLTLEQFIEVVRNTISDGEVCDWVRKNVQCSVEERQAFREKILGIGSQGEMKDRLKMRKEQSGLQGRDEIQCFVDYIDADEGRL